MTSFKNLSSYSERFPFVLTAIISSVSIDILANSRLRSILSVTGFLSFPIDIIANCWFCKTNCINKSSLELFLSIFNQSLFFSSQHLQYFVKTYDDENTSRMNH